MWLVLFDIDGTLLRCGSQIRGIFAASLSAAFGRTGDLDRYDFAGRTDDGIVFDLMTGSGLSEDRVIEVLPRFRDHYLAGLERDLDHRLMELLPGVEEVLQRLVKRQDVLIGLLTGNWEVCARSKLSHFDLNRFFGFGAFGDGHRSRLELPPVALRRARKCASAVSRARTVIVGDSVLDVRCARAHGIASLAVATGFAPACDLERAGAEWVIPDLRQAEHCHPVFAGLTPAV